MAEGSTLIAIAGIGALASPARSGYWPGPWSGCGVRRVRLRAFHDLRGAGGAATRRGLRVYRLAASPKRGGAGQRRRPPPPLMLPALAHVARADRRCPRARRDAALDARGQRATPKDTSSPRDYGAAVVLPGLSDPELVGQHLLRRHLPDWRRPHRSKAPPARETVETFARGAGKEPAVWQINGRPPRRPAGELVAIATGARPLAEDSRGLSLSGLIGQTRFPATAPSVRATPDRRTDPLLLPYHRESYEWRGQT